MPIKVARGGSSALLLQKGGTEAFLKAVEDSYRQLAEELLADTGGTDADLTLRAQADTFVVKLKVKTPKGSIIVERQFVPQLGLLKHELFTVPARLQGGHLADRVMAASLRVVDAFTPPTPWQLRVHANLDVGGYAWLRKGFFPNVSGESTARAAVQALLRPVSFAEAFYAMRAPELPEGRAPTAQQREIAKKARQGKLYAQLEARLFGMQTEDEIRAFVLSDEFREYKDLYLGSDWNGGADPTDPRVRAALNPGAAQAATPDPTPDADPPGRPLSAMDAAIRRQVLIERFKASQVAGFDEVLRAIDRDIRELLTRDDLTAFTRERLQQQLDELTRILRGHYSGFLGSTMNELREFGMDEAEAVAAHFRALGAVETVIPAAEAIWATVLARPLGVRSPSGALLLESFMRGWGEADAQAIVGAIQQGYFEGQTNQQILNRIRGTRAAQYRDGLLDVSRRHAEAILRTATQHVANVARQEIWSANDDIVEAYEWVATLDSRTSQTCRSLDGKRFEVGKGPIPPAHVNCRSATIPVLSGELAALAEGRTRASQDGPVGGDLSYYEWLQSQDAEFQDIALGPTRGRLFREGGLSAEKFAQLNLGRNFEPLTLDEMRRLSPKAFQRAGL